jgi:cysteine desulfurase
LEPLLVGGHQERERRPGTENVLGAIGFGAACATARRDFDANAQKTARLRDHFDAIAQNWEGARRFGGAERVPNTTCVGFRGVDGELLMASLDLEGVCVSTGAACTSGSVAPSPVLLALGLPREVAKTAVRFSFGPDNTLDEVDRVLALLPSLIERIRSSA